MANIFNIKIGGAQLVGETTGVGEPLIFLHAGVADRRMWRRQMEGLADRYQTIAYDRRGFGETKITDEPFSHVEDLRELLEQLTLSRATLIGCSQGGRIAIDFALAFPARVAKLALISPAVSGSPDPEFTSDIQVLMDALDEAESVLDIDRMNEIEAHLWLDGPTSPEGRVSGTLRTLFLAMNGIALRMPELTQEIEPPSAYERLRKLSLPTLVISGELDFPHIKNRCCNLVKMISNAKGEEILDTAHLPSLEKPAHVEKLLRCFLN